MVRGSVGHKRFARKDGRRPVSRSNGKNLFPYFFSCNQTVVGCISLEAAFPVGLSFCGSCRWCDPLYYFPNEEKKGSQKQVFLPAKIHPQFFRSTRVFLSIAVGL